jgi:hypothetical protein
MVDAVVVMVDGRAKVLQRTGHRDHTLLLGLLDARPDLVLRSPGADRQQRLLLVTRPGAGGPAYRTLLERVYVDNEAVPVLVGVQAHAGGDALLQLLDRVARDLAHCRGQLRELTRTLHENDDEAALLVRALGWRSGPEAFWERVEANLVRDRVRVVLVTDRLPDELTRMVEFLDGQLRDVDVRAVELSLYGSGPVSALVPRSTSNGASGHRARHVAPPAELSGVVTQGAPGRHRRSFGGEH